MRTPLLSRVDAPSTSATNYLSAVRSSWQTTESAVRSPIAADGTISNLRVACGTAIASGQYVFTLRKGAANGGAMSDTTVTVTCDSANQTAEDAVHSFTVNAGDEITIKCVPSGSPTSQAAGIQWAFDFTSANASESILISGGATTTGTAAFFAPQGYTSTTTSTLQTTRPMPAAGDLEAMYVQLFPAPGAGTSRTFTIQKNGVDTALTVTVSDTAIAGSVVATVSFARGDTITLSDPVTGSAISGQVNIGLRWAPTTDGEAIFTGAWSGNASPTSAIFGRINGVSGISATTEANEQLVVPQAFVARGLIAICSAAPGAGRSRTLALRESGVSTALTCQLADSNTSAEDTTNSVAIGALSLAAMQHAPAGTPANAVVSYSFVAFTGTATANHKSLLLLGVG